MPVKTDVTIEDLNFLYEQNSKLAAVVSSLNERVYVLEKYIDELKGKGEAT